jgi:hypothetical protein
MSNPVLISVQLRMVVASRDTITLTDVALAAYEQALEPQEACCYLGRTLRPGFQGWSVSFYY